MKLKEKTSKQTELPISNAAITNPYGPSPFPMQYLGAKGRISGWILKEIKEFNPECTVFLDLFAGTGAVGIEALRSGFEVHSNDMQPYTTPVLNSIYTMPRLNIDGLIKKVVDCNCAEKLLSSGRADFDLLLSQEEKFTSSMENSTFNWQEYAAFCLSTPRIFGTDEEVSELSRKQEWNLFGKYYANTYFGIRQSLALDTLRELAESLKEPHKTHLISAVISVMTYAVSSTTHLAQFLKPSSEKNAIHLLKRRNLDIINLVIDRLNKLPFFPLAENRGKVSACDYLNALKKAKPNAEWVVYADPPYFKEHYSRYYHVLDTFYLYDYPKLTINPRLNTTTVGRYRENRLSSDFGKKAKVRNAFSELFSHCFSLNTNLCLSYAETSLVDIDELLALAEKNGYKGAVKDILLMHSGQGQPRNKVIKEYLLMFKAI